MLPIEVRNVLEHGNIEGRRQEDSEESQESTSSENEEKKIPADIRTFIHQIVEGRAFPVPHSPMNMRPLMPMDIPMEQQNEPEHQRVVEEPATQPQSAQQATQQILEQAPQQVQARVMPMQHENQE